jgi:hypothetical protein
MSETPEEIDLLKEWRTAPVEMRRVAKALLDGKGKLSVDAGMDDKGAWLRWIYRWTERGVER